MNFNKAEPTLDYQAPRLVSENNIWEVGIHPVLFGFRVAAGRIGQHTYAVDYCAASDKQFLQQLYMAVVMIFTQLPEEITERELQDFMPIYKRKPILLDPCWEKLQKLAYEGVNYEPTARSL